MLTEFFFSCLFVAGVSVLWRNMREDLPKIDTLFLNRLPWIFRKSLKCGYCFTMWFAFFFLCVFQPLEDWIPPNHLSPSLIPIVRFFFHWIVLGFLSAAIRFVYVIWQERVHDIVHNRGHH